MPIARTKAQKLASKRGRPRLPATDRQPNGQPSRRKASIERFTSERSEDAMNVAVQRRIRDHGIAVACDVQTRTILSPEKQAADPRNGYALGILWLARKITERQHGAGIRFGEDMARFYGLTGIPQPSARAQNMFAVRGSSGEDSGERAERASKARARVNTLRMVLLGVGDIDTGRLAIRLVTDAAVMDDQSSRHWPEQKLIPLRRGLNKLADYYGLPA